MTESDDTIETLLAACRRDHAAWINGDPSGYVLPEDATLMAAMGGTGRGGDLVGRDPELELGLWRRGHDVDVVVARRDTCSGPARGACGVDGCAPLGRRR